MRTIELVEHRHAKDGARDLFFADGKRISRDSYKELELKATRTDTFHTRRTCSGWRHSKAIYLP